MIGIINPAHRVNREQQGSREIHRILIHAIARERIHQVRQVLLEQAEQGRMEERERMIDHTKIHPRMTALEFLATRAAAQLSHHLRVELQGLLTEAEAVVQALQPQAPPALDKRKEKRIIHLHQAHETKTISKVEQIGKVVFRKCRCLLGTCVFFVMSNNRKLEKQLITFLVNFVVDKRIQVFVVPIK
jgi:hypothetical protein